MRYVQIEFYYYCPDPHEWLAGSESSVKCIEANEAVEKAMTDLEIEWRHAYTFPDGSLYKYVRTKLSDVDLECAINTALMDTGINVNHIYAYTDTDPDDPYKPGKSKVCALKERFDETL